MTAESKNTPARAQALFYATGLLSSQEAAEFEAKLARGDPEATIEFQEVAKTADALLRAAAVPCPPHGIKPCTSNALPSNESEADSDVRHQNSSIANPTDARPDGGEMTCN